MLATPNAFEKDTLRQGDVLERTELLSASIGEAHQYYATAPGYNHFLVLTPSCDLALRNGRCAARYITIAAIRPLSLLVERKFKDFNQSIKAPGEFLVSERIVNAKQFLERIIHNTEEGYLFLPGEFFSDGIDRCAFLLLSIALRSSHYENCAKSKTLQLSDVFAAQVGNLTSNLYGQVATPAIEEQTDVNFDEIKNTFYDKYLLGEGIYWLSKEQMRVLKGRISIWKKENPENEPSSEDVGRIVANLPQDQDLIFDRISSVAKENGGIFLHPNIVTLDWTSFISALRSDVQLRRLFRI